MRECPTHGTLLENCVPSCQVSMLAAELAAKAAQELPGEARRERLRKLELAQVVLRSAITDTQAAVSLLDELVALPEPEGTLALLIEARELLARVYLVEPEGTPIKRALGAFLTKVDASGRTP